MPPNATIGTDHHTKHTNTQTYTSFSLLSLHTQAHLFSLTLFFPVPVLAVTMNAIIRFSNDRWPFCRHGQPASTEAICPSLSHFLTLSLSSLQLPKVSLPTSTTVHRHRQTHRHSGRKGNCKNSSSSTGGPHAGTRPLISASDTRLVTGYSGALFLFSSFSSSSLTLLLSGSGIIILSQCPVLSHRLGICIPFPSSLPTASPHGLLSCRQCPSCSRSWSF